MLAQHPAVPTQLVQFSPTGGGAIDTLYSPTHLFTEVTRIWVVNTDTTTHGVLFLYSDDGTTPGGSNTFYRFISAAGSSTLLDGNSNTLGLVLSPGSILACVADSTVKITCFGRTQSIAPGRFIGIPNIPIQLFQGTPSAATITDMVLPTHLRVEITRIWLHNDSNSVTETFEIFYVEDGSAASSSNLIEQIDVAPNSAVQLDGHAESYGLVMAPGSRLAVRVVDTETVVTVFGISEHIVVR